MARTNFEPGDVIRVPLEDYKDTFAEVISSPQGLVLKGLFSESEADVIPITYAEFVPDNISNQDTSMLKAILEVEGKKMHQDRWAEICKRYNSDNQFREGILSQN